MKNNDKKIGFLEKELDNDINEIFNNPDNTDFTEDKLYDFDNETRFNVDKQINELIELNIRIILNEIEDKYKKLYNNVEINEAAINRLKKRTLNINKKLISDYDIQVKGIIRDGTKNN